MLLEESANFSGPTTRSCTIIELFAGNISSSTSLQARIRFFHESGGISTELLRQYTPASVRDQPSEQIGPSIFNFKTVTMLKLFRLGFGLGLGGREILLVSDPKFV